MPAMPVQSHDAHRRRPLRSASQPQRCGATMRVDLRQRHQHADLEGRQPHAIEIQAEERRERAEVGEVEKVKPGETPVRKAVDHAMRSAL